MEKICEEKNQEEKIETFFFIVNITLNILLQKVNTQNA